MYLGGVSGANSGGSRGRVLRRLGKKVRALTMAQKAVPSWNDEVKLCAFAGGYLRREEELAHIVWKYLITLVSVTHDMQSSL